LPICPFSTIMPSTFPDNCIAFGQRLGCGNQYFARIRALT
jgi:hypothetical protein